MAFIKSKSKFENSQCSKEVEGVRCPNTWKQDEEYIYDTEAKKAYCLNHSEINNKIQQKTGGGQFQSSKFKLEQIPVIEGIVYKMMENFEAKYPDKMKDPDVMFESLFKSISGGFKP